LVLTVFVHGTPSAFVFGLRALDLHFPFAKSTLKERGLKGGSTSGRDAIGIGKHGSPNPRSENGYFTQSLAVAEVSYDSADLDTAPRVTLSRLHDKEVGRGRENGTARRGGEKRFDWTEFPVGPRGPGTNGSSGTTAADSSIRAIQFVPFGARMYP
jgi:hypothetical protein